MLLCLRVHTHMYRHAKIIQLELIRHFTERLETIFAFGLLESVHFCRLVTLLWATDNTNITKALNLIVFDVKSKHITIRTIFNLQ